MPKLSTKPAQADPLDLIHQAIAAFDVQIADLQAKRNQLVSLAGGFVAIAPTPAETAPKQRTMSDEARAKISAAAKKRWAKQKKAVKAAQTGKAEAKAVPATVKAPTEKAAAKVPPKPKPVAKTKKTTGTKKAQTTASTEDQNT